jgi:hypothetical protein
MRKFAIAVCGLLVTVIVAVPAQAQYQVGDSVTDFTLNDAFGTPVSLFDYQGQVVWLDFWRFG